MATPDQMKAMEEEIGRLPDLPYPELKARWRKLFGIPTPNHISRQLLVKAIGYQLRDKAGLGLSPEIKRRLREIAAALKDGREDSLYIGPRIKPGTRLVRAWQGKTHIVDVLADGFAWEATKYSSLSAIAKAITGTNWNGYVFFGVKRRPAHNKNATGPHGAKRQAWKAAKSEKPTGDA